MTRPSPVHVIPTPKHPTFRAARLIYAEGSKTEVQLWASRCGFSERHEYRMSMLERAFEAGWLQRLPDQRIALTQSTVEFFDTEHAEPEPVGQVAGPRVIDRMNSKAYVPPKRFVRPDAPDCSVKNWPSHYAKVAP